MKRIIAFAIILMALTACTPFQAQAVETAGTNTSQAGLANPASLYCGDQGNKLEIRTAADGSQNGICVFPDGSTCDEWAYYRGQCGPATSEASGGGPGGGSNAGGNASGGYMPPGTTEVLTDWWGVIKSTQSG